MVLLANKKLRPGRYPTIHQKGRDIRDPGFYPNDLVGSYPEQRHLLSVDLTSESKRLRGDNALD